MSISNYSKTDIIEDEGYRVLQCTLPERLFKIHVEGGKRPNYDGTIELLEGLKPVGHFFFQAKSTEHIKTDKIDNVLFDLNTNFIEYIKQRITNDIGIYFIIDITNNKVYYIVLDCDKLKDIEYTEDQDYVRYHFNDYEEITDPKIFWEKLKRSKYNSNRERIYEMYDLHLIEKLQDAVDEINFLFLTDLKFIKDILFPSTWKFGINFSFDNNVKGFALSKLYKGRNDCSVKHMGYGDEDKFKADEIYKTYHFNNMRVEDDINSFKSDTLHLIVDSYFNNFTYIDLLSDDIVIEKLSSLYSFEKVLRIDVALDEIYNKRILTKSDIEVIMLLQKLKTKDVLEINLVQNKNSSNDIVDKFSEIPNDYYNILNSINIGKKYFQNFLYEYNIVYLNNGIYPFNCTAAFIKKNSDILKFVNNNKLDMNDIIANRNLYQNSQVFYGCTYVDMIKNNTIKYDMIVALLKATVYNVIGDTFDYSNYIK